ncbi:MAG: hypothetical protein JWP97_5946 [Labilithrix sp.]|nr:hypothetical protein [Labilithrix sp.]
MITLIPEDRRDAVRAAFRAAFDVDHPERLEKVAAGLSGALVFRAEVEGRPWLLRLETSLPSAFTDPVRHHACLQSAAAAGVAPAVRFADATTRVAIVDYIAPRPLTGFPGGAAAIAAAIGALIARLQATPVFGQLTDYLDGVDAIIGNLMSLGVVTEAAMAPYLAAHREVRDAYPRPGPAELVSSHNDLNPSNVLYDGTRLWLVDWEAAFANDPHVDPATVAHWFGVEGEGKATLLHTVFGDVDNRVRARHDLMRQVVRTFTACMMLTVTGMRRAPGQAPLTALTGPDLATVRDAMRRGTLQMSDEAGRVALAQATLNAMLEEVRSPGFAAVLRAASS